MFEIIKAVLPTLNFLLAILSFKWKNPSVLKETRLLDLKFISSLVTEE